MSDGNCAIRALRCVGLDLLNPEAPFLTFLRKIVVLSMCFPAVIVVFYQLLPFVGLSVRLSSGALVAHVLADTTLVVSAAVPYVTAHRTGTVPNWALCVLMYGAAVGSLLGSIANPAYPYFVFVAIFSIFACMCEMPLRNVYLVLIAFVFCVSAHNTCATMAAQEVMAADGYRRSTFSGMIGNYLGALIALVIPAVVCTLQTKQFRRLLAAAERANELSRDAAELLRNYDTDGVSHVLDDYRQLPDADPKLVESYTALVANLDRYRPHLPNWLLRPRRDGSDALSSSEASPVGPNLNAEPNPNVLDRPVVVSPSGDGVSQPDSLELNLLERLISAGRVASDVAYALVDFRISADMPSCDHGAVISGFVNTVHELATATQAELHCFVGDTVQLSWNAAVSTIKPEGKAARFLCHLKTATESTPGQSLSVAGAVMSGTALSQFGGSGYFSAFVVSLPWRAKLLACFALAKRHRAFVCAGTIVEAAVTSINTRAVELLCVTQNGRESAVVVHELVGLRASVDLDDSWMYMQGDAVPNNSMASDPLQLCVDGYYTDALGTLGKPQNGESPLLANLRVRAEAHAAQRVPPRSFAVSLCACDDT
jgi:hypothetical protein